MKKGGGGGRGEKVKGVVVAAVEAACVAVAGKDGAEGSKIMVTERGRGPTTPHVNLLSSVMEGGTPVAEEWGKGREEEEGEDEEEEKEEQR